MDNDIFNRIHLPLYFIACFLWLVSHQLPAQEVICGMQEHFEREHYHAKDASTCLPIDPKHHSTCYNADVFLPSSTDNHIPIRINLIFLQRNDGTGNFQENNEDHQIYLDEAMEQLNHLFANLTQDIDTPHCYVGSTFVNDTKVRFVDNRYYIRDEYGWDSQDSTYGFHCQYDNWYLVYLDNAIRQCDTILPGINVFFTEHAGHYYQYENGITVHYLGSSACSRFPVFDNMNHSSRVHMPERYTQYWCKVFLQHPDANDSVHALLRTKYAGWLVRTLSHELGHSLNLYHPSNNLHDPYETCHNSIMNPGGAGRGDFLSSSKISRMHYALMGSNLQNYVPASAYAGTKIVAQNVSFPQMRFYHSLSIQASDTMNCEAIMPEQATIYIRGGGNLTIDGGHLHSITDKWNGVVVKEGGTLVLSNTSISDYNIVVEDGGILTVVGDLTLSGDHYIKVEDGGCICIDEHAIITLTNSFSIIDFYPNALLGCSNTSDAHCVESVEEILISGNGKIATYNDTICIQNETISSDVLKTGSSVKAGYDVTSQKPVGDVVVSSNGHLRIQSTGDVTLTRDVEVLLGGELDIRK